MNAQETMAAIQLEENRYTHIQKSKSPSAIMRFVYNSQAQTYRKKIGGPLPYTEEELMIWAYENEYYTMLGEFYDSKLDENFRPQIFLVDRDKDYSLENLSIKSNYRIKQDLDKGMLKCTKCLKLKPTEDFRKAAKAPTGFHQHCKACMLDYDRGLQGLIGRLKSTSRASSKERGHPLPTYTAEELMEWALGEGLLKLHEAWKNSGYETELRPSIDRLDASKYYDFDNMKLTTWKENMTKGYREKKEYSVAEGIGKPVRAYTQNGQLLGEYHSVSHASRVTGVTRSSIQNVLKGTSFAAGNLLWVELAKMNSIQGVPVGKYSEDGELVAKYEGLKEAQAASGLTRGSVARCLAGRRETAGGFIWKYVD